MNEWLLVIFINALIVVGFLVVRRLKQPLLTYASLIGCVLLLLLVWWSPEIEKWPVKIVQTVFILSIAIKAIRNYQKLYTPPRSKQDS